KAPLARRRCARARGRPGAIAIGALSTTATFAFRRCQSMLHCANGRLIDQKLSTKCSRLFFELLHYLIVFARFFSLFTIGMLLDLLNIWSSRSSTAAMQDIDPGETP
ncbi:MAG: hypothetical protein ABL908_01765, partial [Hyphomicrobium sp.]